jgi:S1-C subfamily serine protease
MALIPPFFLDSVVAIGFAEASGKVAYGGTGFLLGRRIGIDPSNNKPTYRLFLVTNRHVLDGNTTAFLRFNPESPGAAHVFDAPLQDANGARIWFALADPSVDIAIMPINATLLEREKIKFAFFAEDVHVLTHVKASEAGLSEGDGVFVLGFPMGNVGEERNYVVVRHGIIARIRDSLSGAVNQFLIDATVFPGNSGGPVVTRPEITAITGTKSSNQASLVGVVAAYLPYHDVAVSQQTRRPRIVFEENSGLAAVVPIDRAIETVNAFLAARVTASPQT